MSEIQASFIGAIIGAAVFAAICLIFDAPTTGHLLWVVAVGAFVGVLAAPEISPESYLHPKAFQVLSGVGAGLCVGLFFQAPLIYICLLGVLGAIIGYFAKQFIDIVHVP